MGDKRCSNIRTRAIGKLRKNMIVKDFLNIFRLFFSAG